MSMRIAEVEAERAERSRDKERGHERMVEVKRGVESIIQDLEAKVEKAEAAARDCPRFLREGWVARGAMEGVEARRGESRVHSD